MSEKSLKELLYKYLPPPEYDEILSSGVVTRSRVDKDKRFLEVFADFDRIISKNELYAIEAEVIEAYKLNGFRIFPHYPSSLWGYSYVPEILRETERMGSVAKGFFSDYTYTLDDASLNVKISLPKNGVVLLERADTPKIIESIIFSEFGVKISVTLEHDDFGSVDLSDSQKQRLELYDRQIKEAERNYGTYSNDFEKKPQESEPAEEKLPRIGSVFGDSNATVKKENGIITIGHRSFDVREPNYAVGTKFEINPVPISSVTRPVRNVIFIGEIFQLTKESNRAGDKINLSFAIFDGDSSIFVKRYSMLPEDANEI